MAEHVYPREVGKVVEITEEQAEYMLNVLPPIYGSGCFAVSEPYSHTDEGRARYHWCAKRGAKHFVTLGTKAEAHAAFGAM